jgi:hypothetical protein
VREQTPAAAASTAPAAPPAPVKPWRWPMTLKANNKVTSDACIAPGAKALPGVKLPNRLRVQGPDGHSRLVRVKFLVGPEDRTTVWASAGLVRELAPHEDNPTETQVKAKPASKMDVFIYTRGKAQRKIVVAGFVLVGALVGAVAAFAADKDALAGALAVFVVVCVVAVAVFVDAAFDALATEC